MSDRTSGVKIAMILETALDPRGFRIFRETSEKAVCGRRKHFLKFLIIRAGPIVFAENQLESGSPQCGSCRSALSAKMDASAIKG